MAHEHSFATPAPAGLAALAVACFGFAAVFLGKVGLEGLPLLAAWLVGGFVVQYTTAVIELKDHNLAGGNVFLFFAAFFMLAAALSVFAKFMLHTFGMKPQIYVEGWCWLAGAAFLTVVTPAYLRGSKIFFLAVVMADIVLWLLCFLDLGLADPKIFKPFAAYLLIGIGFIGIYLAGATVCNTVFGKVIYPVK